jgi:mannose-6-phosphate isomerase-like protein (cupin superfamily)
MYNVKRPFLIVLLIGFVFVSAMAQKTKRISVWKGTLSHVAETQVTWEQLQAGDDHVVAVSYLRDDGQAEVHPSQTEILVAQAGAATLVVDANCAEADDVNDNAIEKTAVRKQVRLSRGDVVDIPPNCQHQLRVGPSGYFIYTTIRMDSH